MTILLVYLMQVYQTNLNDIKYEKNLVYLELSSNNEDEFDKDIIESTKKVQNLKFDLHKETCKIISYQRNKKRIH